MFRLCVVSWLLDDVRGHGRLAGNWLVEASQVVLGLQHFLSVNWHSSHLLRFAAFYHYFALKGNYFNKAENKMGGLTRKRRQARIVKKVRTATQKKGVNVMNLPTGIREQWDKNKSVTDNFKELGLSTNMAPRMLQSKEGSKLTNKVTKELNPAFYSARQRNRPEEPEEEPREPKDLTLLFPEIRPAAESIIELTPKKLKHDEKAIVERLITKYGEENHMKMAKDSKINYLQWSKGQCARHVEIYKDLKAKDKL